MKDLDLTAPFRQLVERKLWPLAVLLLAAAAAVPLLLAKSGDVPAPAPSAAAPKAGQTAVASAAAVQPVVSVADETAGEDRRKVLGARKDPFRPARGPRAKKADSAPRVAPPATDRSSGSATAKGGGGAPAPVVTPPTSSPTMPVAPKRTYELYSLNVRFGETVGELTPSNLKRLTALPDKESPAVVYLGMMRDRRTAVFLVDARATVQGDGRCLPSASNCQTLHLKVGETAFFDMAAADGDPAKQYQLDIVRVARKLTTDARAARRSLTAVASGGREVLRERVSRVGRYRYDARSGTLKRISPKAWRAAAARASAN